MSLLERCPHFRGWYVQASMELRPEDVSLLERCPHFRGWYVQASMELRPEDVSLLEKCPHFRGWYVQASMELGPEDVSLLERCPHFRGWYVQTSMELRPEDVSPLERCSHFRGWYTYVITYTVYTYTYSRTCLCHTGVLYFILRYLTDKYNIYYIYRPAPFNGRQFLHRSAINFVIVGVVHLQISTLFFSAIRLGELLYVYSYLYHDFCPIHIYGTKNIERWG